MKIAAIYARVSSDQQKEENTIASQTAALVEFAREQGFSVPDEWVIEDEGFSGASLLRPGLERLRDLAAEGQIQAILIHSPDRLSRKYAYQVLLTEEFARHGVETIFIKAPHVGTPEDQLMLQFQGMIAEYERAQILERSRRGKRHRAKAGEVSVLGGAPYGYRYIRKTPEMPARYEIDAVEAAVVRLIFDKYTVEGFSIGAIARLLREMGPATRKRVTRWERSVVWGMLRNPAYQGTACFNKTQVGPRQKVTKPFCLSGRAVHGEKTSAHERPRDEWIEVPVPAIVSEETFALAAERLDAFAMIGIVAADDLIDERTIRAEIVEVLAASHQKGVTDGALEMAMAAFDRSVLVGNALVVACRRHAIMGAQFLVASCQVLPRIGTEIAESRRQAVAAVVERRPAKGPERVLQPFGQGDEALAAENNVGVFEAGPGKPEVVEQMIERLARDRHAQATHIGKIRQSKPARLVNLAEDHLLLFAVNGTP